MAKEKNDLNPPPILINPTRDSIIEQLYSREDLKIIIKKIVDKRTYDIVDTAKYLKDELYQELFAVLCEMDSKVLLELYTNQELDYYILGILSNMFNGKRSSFSKKIKSYILNRDSEFQISSIKSEEEIELKHLLLDGLDKAIDNLNPVERNAMHLFLKHGFIKKVADQVNISKRYTSQIVKTSKSKIKKQIEEFLKNNETCNY